MKNLNRHLKRNLAKPIDARLTVTEASERVQGWHLRNRSLRLLNMIHAQFAPRLARLHYKQALLDRCIEETQGREKQGYSCADIGDKYNGELYKVGQIDPSLAKLNDPFDVARMTGGIKASEHTRGIDNSNALKSVSE